MTKAALKVIADAMREMGIRYGLMEYNVKPIVYPYFIGEYSESIPTTEDGKTEAQFTLTGYSRTTWDTLEDCKQQIGQKFDQINGLKVIAANGNAVAVFYENALVLPTWDEELKKIQINLNVKEWRVN